MHPPTSLWYTLGFPLGWLLSASVLIAAGAPATSYMVIDIGEGTPVPGNMGVTGLDLDDDQTVLGCRTTPDQGCDTALLFPTVILVPNPPGAFFAGDKIRNGVVVGNLYSPAFLDAEGNAPPHAARWTAQAGVQELNATLAQSVTNAVSADGTIVSVITADGQRGPAVWRQGVWTFLPTSTPPPYLDDVRGISSNGLILANAFDGVRTHPRIWVMGLPTDLEIPPDARFFVAQGINSAGSVVGYGSGRTSPIPGPDDDGVTPWFFGYRWTAAGGWTTIAPLPGDRTLLLRAINDADVSVGESQDQDRALSHAIRWTPTQGLEALAPLVHPHGWAITQAVTINPAGTILAYGTQNTVSHAVLLVPDVPIVVTPGPVTFVATVQGDFDHNGFSDEAGITSTGEVWLRLAGQAWRTIPGYLTALVAGDFDGQGRESLAGLSRGNTIWILRDATHWSWIPGTLNSLIACDCYGDGKMHLAGLANGYLWRSPRLGVWEWVPGHLNTLVAGDFYGIGKDVFAGLDRGFIWVQTAAGSWQWVPGFLRTLQTDRTTPVHDDLVGYNGLGCYRMHTVGTWQLTPCTPLALAQR